MSLTLRQRLVVAAAWTYSVVRFVKSGGFLTSTLGASDFFSMFPAPAVAAWAGRASVYAGSLAEQWLPAPRWGYGPIFNLVTLPLLIFGELATMYRVWLFVCHLFFLLALFLLYRETLGTRVTVGRVTLAGVLALNYYPLLEGLAQCNIEVFELLLVAAAMNCYARRRDAWAGTLVGIAAMTKFLPGVLVPYFLLKRRWRAFASSVIVILAIGLAAQFTLGWQNNWVVIQLLQGSYLDTQLNQAVSGAVLRLAAFLHQSALGLRISQLLIVAFAMALAWFLWRRRASTDWQIEWSILLVASVMMPPHNQNYYLLLLLVPYFVLLGRRLADPVLDRRRALLLVLSWFLTAWPLPLSLVGRLVGTPLLAERLLYWSVSLWGVLLLVYLLVTEPASRHLEAGEEVAA